MGLASLLGRRRDRLDDRGVARQRRRLERNEIRRFTTRRRDRRNRLIAAAGLLAFVAAFVGLMIWSPATIVRDIRVTGLERIPEEKVRGVLADLEGQPLSQIGTPDIGARLEPIVLVQSYALEVVPPSTIVVDIVERTPVGAIASDAGFTAVDAAGVDLWTEPAAPADLPEIKSNGKDAPGFASAAAVSLALPPEFRTRIATIDATTMDDVKLTTRDGTSVVWGSSEDSPKKAEVLLALLAATENSAAVYDVSSPDTPVTR